MAMTVTWKPNIGPALVLNSTSYPINDSLEIEVEMSDPSVKKAQMGGEWPTFGYPGSATIRAEGTILDVGATFWANRNAFLEALTPQAGELTSRRHGILTIDDDDMDEPAFAECRVISRTAHLETLSPNLCPYLVSFKAFEPYFTGKVTGGLILLG